MLVYRMVITTVTFDDGTEEDAPEQRLTLKQEAEKDQKFHMSSTIIYEVRPKQTNVKTWL